PPPPSRAIAQRELPMTEPPQERDIPGRTRETVAQHPDRAFGIAHGQRQFSAGEPGFTEFRRRGDRRVEHVARAFALALRERNHAEKMQRRRESRLDRDDLAIPVSGGREIPMLMLTHRNT